MTDQSDEARRAPGWKRDPWQRFVGRYWDGQQWTDQVVSAEKVRSLDPVPTTPPPRVVPPPPPEFATTEGAQSGPTDIQRQSAYLILGGAGAIGVGCFLPWASITAPFIGTISKAGIEGDGQFFLVLAAAAAAVAFDLVRNVPSRAARRRWALIAIIGLLGALTVFEVVDLSNRFTDVSDEEFPIATSYGAGLWLVGIGVLVALAGWGRMPWAEMEFNA